MKKLINKPIKLFIAFTAMVFLAGCGGGVGGGADVDTLKCGDVMSKAFVQSLGISGADLYSEAASKPCMFDGVTFVFWPGDQFDTLMEGAQMLPDPENIKETKAIGSRTLEYDGSYLGHTVEVGFVTKNKNATAMVTFTGDQAELGLAKKMAEEMEKNLR